MRDNTLSEDCAIDIQKLYADSIQIFFFYIAISLEPCRQTFAEKKEKKEKHGSRMLQLCQIRVSKISIECNGKVSCDANAASQGEPQVSPRRAAVTGAYYCFGFVLLGRVIVPTVVRYTPRSRG